MPTRDPSPEVLVAILAAVDSVWPRAVPIDPRARRSDQLAPSWRFSGRSWGAPVAADRSRPSF